MIADLGSLEFFVKNESSVTYQTFSEAIVKGEVTQSYSVEIPIQLLIVPLSGQEIRNQDSGNYTSEDKLCIERKNQTLKTKDIINYDNSKYEVERIYNYLKEVGVVKYIVKKKGK